MYQFQASGFVMSSTWRVPTPLTSGLPAFRVTSGMSFACAARTFPAASETCAFARYSPLKPVALLEMTLPAAM